MERSYGNSSHEVSDCIFTNAQNLKGNVLIEVIDRELISCPDTLFVDILSYDQGLWSEAEPKT